MSKPIVKSGKFSAGKDFECGENVVVNVAEEMVVGDRVTIAPNSYFEGRRVVIGDDFFGYDWGHPNGFFVNQSVNNVGGDLVPTGSWLSVGQGRIDEEEAILTVGFRCTFHDNRIDLAKAVRIGNDVGLSPEVVIYNHGYWLSPLDGYPSQRGHIAIEDRVIVGFRSTILPWARLGEGSVFGAGSVITGKYHGGKRVYGGNPAKELYQVQKESRLDQKIGLISKYLDDFQDSVVYRKIPRHPYTLNWPRLKFREFEIELETMTASGGEDEYTDDLRWFLFTRGIRVYTNRRFRKLLGVRGG